MTVLVRCPAKVNLHLEVLGRRADGFHELRTLFATVGIWDELVCESAPAGVLELEVSPPGAAPAGDDNLVIRAALELQRGFGSDRGARMQLFKAIPAAAGLGGGSSDAAGALVALSHLWGGLASSADLLAVAAAIGSDVPFFLVGGVAWGIGRGSEVYPLSDLPGHWVVVLPGKVPVSTAQVYGSLPPVGVDLWRPSAVYQWIVGGGELPLLECRNDLQSTVVKRWSEVGDRLQLLRDTEPLLALLSGSGGAVFGLYEGESRARAVAAELAEHGPLVAPLLSRELSQVRPSAREGSWRYPK